MHFQIVRNDITANIHWWHWKLDVKICLQARTGKCNGFNWHSLVHSFQRKQKRLFKSRLSHQSESEQHHACVALPLAEKKHTAFLWELNLTYQQGSGRSWLYNAAEHLYSNTLLEKYSKGMRKEGRKDTVSERVSHQHHEITCSEADHCFLARESFD